MISRRTSRVFCELCSQKTSRGTLPVNSNRTGYCERSLLISRNIFNDRGIYVIFIQTHLHLHRCGIVGEFHSSEVVKEEQDAETDTDGIGNFQDSIAGCGLPGDLGVISRSGSLSWISFIRSITEITYRPVLSGSRFATGRTLR